MGPADDSVVVPSTVVSHPSGSLEEVDRLLAKVGIALVTLIDGPVNHRVALPNKLFQAVSVGVPVVAANLPEMRSLVDQHGIGVTYTPRDPDSMTEAIGRVRDDYPTYVANVRAAQSALSWDVDSSRLSDIYESIDGGPPPG
jgi:glycosyltransferase involved in cell wall biosynthesis